MRVQSAARPALLPSPLCGRRRGSVLRAGHDVMCTPDPEHMVSITIIIIITTIIIIIIIIIIIVIIIIIIIMIIIMIIV